MNGNNKHSGRILVIDDNEAIHHDFRKILAGDGRLGAFDPASADPLAETAAKLFGPPAHASCEAPVYEVDCALQGQEGLEKVKQAREAGRPYQLAFVDIRMPPGWDGVETIQHLWNADPEIQTVICSAYSDYSWTDIREKLGDSDRLLILRKPFDAIEISQLAATLVRKHEATRLSMMKQEELETIVAARTAELESINRRLIDEINHRRLAEERLRHEATHDRLTGLPNRAMLLEKVEQAVQRTRTEPGYRFAVLFMDLDDFKKVNDTHGHEMGDALLVEVGERLSRALRETDFAVRFTDGVASRLGGDEFVVVLDELKESTDVLSIAERLRQAVSIPFQHRGVTLTPRLSIGAATSDRQYTCADDIMRDADAAVYQAKREGKHRSIRFDTEMRTGKPHPAAA